MSEIAGPVAITIPATLLDQILEIHHARDEDMTDRYDYYDNADSAVELVSELAELIFEGTLNV
ncbi:hypothetical protein [Streptomyces sp. NPDC018045]|uniref:hypothetical protein n=1 Tax=Streptomyces sp. NPDC018045 TaxID=3365037 RepID=UPI0037BAB803